MYKCEFCDYRKGGYECRNYVGSCYWAIQAMIRYKKELKGTHTHHHNYNHNYYYGKSKKRYY